MNLPATPRIPGSAVWLRLGRTVGPPGLAAGVAWWWDALVPAGVLATLAVGLGGLALAAPATLAALERAGAAVGWGVRRGLTVVLLGGLYLAVFPVGRVLAAVTRRAPPDGGRGIVAQAGWRSRKANAPEPRRSA